MTRVLGGTAALLTAALGLFVVLAWWMGEWALAAFAAEAKPMAPVSAVLFAGLGLSLSVLAWRPGSRAGRGASTMTAVVTLAISVLVLLQAWSGFRLPWDNWFLEAPARLGNIPLGRMSPLTAIAFALAATGVLTEDLRVSSRHALTMSGTLASGAAFTIGAVTAVGYLAGSPLLYGSQSVPMALSSGIGFLMLGTSLLLAGLAPSEGGGGPLPDPIVDKRPGIRRRELAASSVVAGLIISGAFFYLQIEQTEARQTAFREIEAIANLKVERIESWREERISEARFLARTGAVARDVAALLARPHGRVERERLSGWLDPIRGGERYRSALVFDSQGHLLLSVPDSTNPTDSQPGPAFSDALAARDAIVSEIYRTPDGGTLLDFIAPIHIPLEAGVPIPTNRRNDGGAAAEIVLRLDPDLRLFPIVRTWPLPSGTAEGILVRRDGDDILFLSELRHRPGPSLTLAGSAQDPDLPAARALRGDRRAFEGIDYRAARVVAAGRQVRNSSWALVTKIDQEEAYQPVRRQAFPVAAFAGSLIVSLGLAGAFLARQRRADALLRTLEVERERNALAQRLALITRHANDIIILAGADGRILEANERALETYGYTREEIGALTIDRLRAPQAAGDPLMGLDGMRRESALFETMHQRKDGSLFPVEVSARGIEIDGAGYLLEISRDISERRKHLSEIARVNRLYSAHSQVNQALIHATTRETLLRDVCQRLVEHGGFPLTWVGWLEAASGVVEPVAQFGDATGYLGKIRVTADETPEGRGPAGRAIAQNRTCVFNDFLTNLETTPWHEAAQLAGLRAAAGLPVRVEGRAAGVLVVYASEAGFFGPEEVGLLEEAALDLAFGLDILEREARRAEAERALAASEVRYRRLFESAKDGILILDAETGMVVDVNLFLVDLLGHSRGDFLGKTLWDLGFFKDVAANREGFAKLQAEEYVRYENMPLETAAGRRIDVEFVSNVYLVDGGKVIQCNIRDITERRLADEALRTSLQEKEALLREVHHRVKNNLQVITSLLRLESSRSGEPGTRSVLKDMQGRIRSMALLHETLYRTGNFARVDLADYLRQLALQLFRAQNDEASPVRLVLELESCSVGIDQAIPCALIANELLSNSLKHGFPNGRSGEVRLSLAPEPGGSIRMAASDNGVGLPADFESRRGQSLGLQLVSDLVRQLGGGMEVLREPGATFSVTFGPNRHSTREVPPP